MSLATLAGWAVAAALSVSTLGLWCSRSRRLEAIARACHEVRGPLTAAGLGLSLSARTGILSPDHARAIETELGRAALALEDLTASRARSTAATHALAPVSLAQLLTEGVVAAQGRASAAGVELRSDWEGPDAVVWGVRLRLAQVLANLVANAIEHGEGPVCVRGGLRGTHARIEVADGGPGLPATVAELARRPRGGAGARGRGLAIAADIVSRHGGTISTAPVADGAIVVLSLPAARSAARSRRA